MQRSRSALLTLALVAAITTLGLSVGAGFVCSPAAQPSKAAVNALRGALPAAVLPVAANAMDEASSLAVAGLDDQLLQVSNMVLVSTVSLSIALVIWGRNGF
mmetsp:Transcript_43991/g.101538  ORF Transcript_43991/g.101538 Transcript_43991/m.101538 type:complete len:102 (-) Transcript_43991:166-471(-)